MLANAVDNPPAVVITPATVEAQFEFALRLIDNDQAAAAIPNLEFLYNQTKAPRIHLEWARALLFAGRLAESRKLFVEIYNANPPPAVKATILRFIEQIDHKAGNLRIGVSATKTSNPLGQPSEVQLYFFGNPFTLQLNPKDKNLLGVVFNASYDKAFSNGLDIRANTSFREMPKHPDANQFFGDVSVGKQIKGLPLEVRVGGQIEQMTNQSFRLPYVELGYRKAFSQRLDIQPRLQVGYYDFVAGQGLSGMNFRLNVPVSYMFDPAKVISVGPRIEMRDAKFGEQRYINAGFYAEAVATVKRVTIDATVYPYTTQFLQTDPFWGQRRSDKALYAGVAISSDRVRLNGLLPTLNPFCALNSSNIGFYKINNCGFNVGVRKIF